MGRRINCKWSLSLAVIRGTAVLKHVPTGYGFRLSGKFDQKNMINIYFFTCSFIQSLCHSQPACFSLSALPLNCVKCFTSMTIFVLVEGKTFRQLFPISLMFPLCHQACGWLAAELINWLAGRFAIKLWAVSLTEWMIDWPYSLSALFADRLSRWPTGWFLPADSLIGCFRLWLITSPTELYSVRQYVSWKTTTVLVCLSIWLPQLRVARGPKPVGLHWTQHCYKSVVRIFFTFPFRAFSRRFSPKRLTVIHTFMVPTSTSGAVWDSADTLTCRPGESNQQSYQERDADSTSEPQLAV